MRPYVLAFLIAVPLTLLAGNQPGYYRFPTIHGSTIIFTAEGDLWKIGLEGGVAQRLTTHPGVESRAAISPDGSTVAFSGQYEGPTEIYTMPLTGGLPTRRTYESGNAIEVGWTPDGKVLYATRRFSTLPNTQLATIDPKTNAVTLIPLSEASDGSYDADGKTLYFTRLPFQGSHTKRYQGGTAQNIWKYVMGGAEAIPLTQDYPGTSKNPMWYDHRIYFVSDRDGTMNLWSMDENGGDLKQLTHEAGWDVASPAVSEGKIVYKAGADLHLFDIASGQDRLIPISLDSDFDQTRVKWIKEPMDFLTALHVSPAGDRIVMTSRGRVFVAPAQKGRLIEVTRKEGVRYRDARFLPDGTSIIVLSDETGELEFWKAPANGVGPPVQVTRDGHNFRFEGIPSPDGKWIAYADRDQQLWLLDLAKKSSKRIAASDQDVLSDLRWSPDSRWLAYVRTADNTFRQIMVYRIEDGTTTAVTSDRADSYSPAWSTDGKWLCLLSDRYLRSSVASPWGPRQPEPYFDKTTKIYLLSLLKDQRSPFEPWNELLKEDGGEKASSAGGGEGKKSEPRKEPVIRIDLDGIQTRLMEVPIPSGNYDKLSVTAKYLYWTEHESGPDGKTRLSGLEIKNKDVKSTTIVDDIRDYELSADGKKLMVQKKDGVYIIDAGGEAPKELEKSQVDLKGWTFPIIPREEWRQMFVDAWRLERDFFYDKNMHGTDWKALLEKHLPLVDRVSDREELDDLIAQLVGELSSLHIFVVGGDKRTGQDQLSIGSLGALLVRDDKAGGYRVEHIFRSDPDAPERSSPLARPGVGVAEGDIIESINGIPVLSAPDPSALLENQADRQVLLRVRPGGKGAGVDKIVKPFSPGADADLRYDEWEYTRRLRVEEEGHGQIGYVHLRAMAGDNYSEWARNFYPVYNRQALIIDVRNNRGGNIDSWILEKLLRKAWFFWQPRVGKPFANMQYAFRGHMVVVCNEFTASDGEAFTEGFRRLGLGKVIGTRTWGGEIWLSFDNYLVDKGIASAAETGVYGPERQWLIEGRGVAPDIVVDNLPHATFGGGDAQLDTAVRYLLDEIKMNPVTIPPAPPYPDKSFKEKGSDHR